MNTPISAAATKEVTENAALTCTVSSLLQKQDILYIDASGIDLVKGMQPVQFAYRDNPSRDRWGFIAEWNADVDPKLADAFDATGRANSLDQNAILAVIVKALQEVFDRQDGADARLSVLEARIAALEAENGRLKALTQIQCRSLQVGI